MKAHLLFESRDLNTGQPLPSNATELIQDLELATLFGAMASDDRFLYDIATRVVLSSLNDPSDIVYRQHVLGDCITQPGLVREMYSLAVDAITAERKIYRSSYGGPASILRRSIEALEMFVTYLRWLRQIAEDHSNKFPSKGFTAFFDTIKTNLDDQYFSAVAEHLGRLKFKDGTSMSAEVGPGIKGDRYVLHMPRAMKQPWKERIGMAPRSVYSFEIHPRDEAGGRALAELNNRGLNLVANALAQSTDHILSFFTMLAAEIGFYAACLNLWDRLSGKNEPVCMPVPLPWGPPAHCFGGLYDVCLALRTDTRVVGNTANADGRSLMMVTGANSGGKSTFLRSVGLGQLMMQAGMFVGAGSFRANVCNGLFTHFIREEDTSMASGKLDEELARMDQIAETITPGSVVLFNESFAATNEREGSEIARQIVAALLGAGIESRCSSSPISSLSPTVSTTAIPTPRCSLGPSGPPTGNAASSSSRAARCRPATAKTSTTESGDGGRRRPVRPLPRGAAHPVRTATLNRSPGAQQREASPHRCGVPAAPHRVPDESCVRGA